MIQTTGGNATDKLVVRSKYGSFPLNTSDWTALIRFKYNAAITGGKYASVFNLFHSLTDFTTPYVFLGSQPNTDNIFLEVYDGVSFTDSPTQAIVTNAQGWAAITYNSTTHNFVFIVNGSTVGTINVNMSTVVFDILNLLGDGASGTKSAISVAYCRAWSRILNSSELTAEAAAIVAVSQTGLLWDCPLQTGIDLTSHNNTLNQLSAIGTITTDLTDPLLSTVAGPPTNIDPNTATLIDYNSAIFQNTLTGGAATTVWHKAVAQPDDKVWGAGAFGDLVTYKPAIAVYDGLTNALANNILVTNNPLLPIQFPVTPGNTYYFRSLRNGAVTPATLQLSVLRGLTINIPQGSLAIPDVTDGFPLAFLDNISGYPINWVNGFPPGEEVGILIGGRVLVQDANTNGVKLYSNLGDTLIATPPVSSRFDITGSNQISFVAAIAFAGTDQFVLIDINGNINPTTYSFGAGGIGSITLNPDTTIAYITQSTGTKKFVLATSTISAFASIPGGFLIAPNIICLQDGTVIVGYNHAGVACEILRYNPDGTTANTYTLAADDQIERIAPDNNAPTTDFWVWSQPTNQLSRFYKIRLSDGALLTTISNAQKYNDGKYQAGASVVNTPIRFGHSFSCPLWITVQSISTVKSGLYKIIPSVTAAGSVKTQDSEWIDASAGTSDLHPIPNPFVEQYLAGDEE